MSADAPREVVVALEAPASLEIVAIAAAVARSLAAPLEAVLLEDERLAAAAALPFTRELVPGRREPMAFDPAGLERSLRLESDRLRKVVRTEAEAAGVAWSMRVVRSPREQVVAHHAVVVIAAERPSPALPLLVTPTKPRRRVVVATAVGDALAAETTRVAARLARRAQMRLHLVIAGGDRPAFHAAEERLQAILTIEGVEASVTHATGDLLGTLRDLHPTVVAVGRDGAPSLADDLAGSLRCPLLVVREGDAATTRT